MEYTAKHLANMYEAKYDLDYDEAYCIASNFFEAVHYANNKTNLLMSYSQLLGCLSMLSFQKLISKESMNQILDDFKILLKQPDPDLAMNALQSLVERLLLEIESIVTKNVLEKIRESN